ncbi:MAG: putative leader peptide [Pseudonocardiaceae bacterium]
MTALPPYRPRDDRDRLGRLDVPVLLTTWLTERRHVDLLRLASALCRSQ